MSPRALQRSLMALYSSRKSSPIPLEKVAKEGEGEGKGKGGYFFRRNRATFSGGIGILLRRNRVTFYGGIKGHKRPLYGP